jgi:hypothetical protein
MVPVIEATTNKQTNKQTDKQNTWLYLSGNDLGMNVIIYYYGVFFVIQILIEFWDTV